MSSKGYFGSSYDRYAAHNEQSTVHKLKETYWTTKSAVYKKLGKKQDAHIVASDAELDAKLEVFKAIQKSSMDLLRAIEMYQDRLCALSQEENAMGRFLKAHSQEDKTRAGKMMAAVGKAQSFSSQQRLALRVPLVRLYQEVETFRYRAISDTLLTINRMETARTEYRGALMWMKDASDELDPDTYKQLEKFRKVQAQVKKTKSRFDKLKLDCMQKIDLLAASRCNMYSHVLANYQTTLLTFWSKTSRTMSAVAESFKGYQYYEFNMLKELAETSKKLANETGGDKEIHDGDGKSNNGSADEDGNSEEERQKKRNGACEDRLIGDLGEIARPNMPSNFDYSDSQSLFDSETKQHSTQSRPKKATPDDSGGTDRLINFDNEDGHQKDGGSMTNLLQAVDKEIQRGAKREEGVTDEAFIDFEDEDNEQTIEDIKRKQDAEFDITAKHFTAAEEKKRKEKMAAAQNNGGQKDLLSDDLADDLDRDDLTLLNEILNTPSTGEDDFSSEWQAVFGAPQMAAGANVNPMEGDPPSQPGSEFLPSNLLDMTRQMGAMNMAQPGMPPNVMGGLGMMGGPQQGTPLSQQQPSLPQPPQQPQAQSKATSKKGKTDMSAWFNLFADLDPLADPDAIGRQQEAGGMDGRL